MRRVNGMKDRDGIPDTYYEALDADEMTTAMETSFSRHSNRNSIRYGGFQRLFSDKKSGFDITVLLPDQKV